YMITSDGAGVHDTDSQQIFGHNHDRANAADLFGIVRNDPQCVTNIYREDEWYMNRHRPKEMRFFKEAVFTYKLYEPGELDPQGISKVFFTCEDHEHLLPLEQA
ncbi:sugar/pyridoxal phosphate phosphatase YigL, partial [Klebsiella pneumoniae]